MRLLSLVLVVWLVIGGFAAYQRDYFQRDNSGCAKTSTVLVTVVAGPVNYLGANPQVKSCKLPQPSR